jgi:chromosome segregation ATPase
LFGNARLKEALFEAKIENATLKIEVDSLKRDRDLLESRISAEHHIRMSFEKDIEELDSENQDLKVKNAVLLERLDLLANHLPPAPTQSFNTISEEAEDADYALHSGLIDRDEYEAILASAGAINTEISFDSESLSRL